jgi:hypothetical protein
MNYSVLPLRQIFKQSGNIFTMKKTIYLVFLAAALGAILFITKPLPKKGSVNQNLSPQIPVEESYPVHSLTASELSLISSAVAEIASSTTYSRVPSWKKPSSSEPGVPLLITRDPEYSTHFYIYNFNSTSSNTVKLIDRNIKYAQSVDLRHGQIAPLESFDLLYTAYLDSHNSLQLLSNGTLHKELIYSGKDRIGAPLAWSPDSKKLLFLTSVYQGEGEAGAVYDPEYYKVLDTENGSILTLRADAPLSLENFLDNDHITVRLQVEEKEIISAVELGTFKVDHEAYQQKFGFANAVIQSDSRYANPWGGFARYGTRFAYTVSIAGDKESEQPAPGMVSGPSIAMVVYGDSQHKMAKVLAEGSWAQYQQSLISPQGDKLIYEEENHDTPYVRSFFVLYDSAMDKQRSYKYEYETHLEKWLDNDRILMELLNSSTSPSTYGVFNTVTGQMIDVFDKGRVITPIF